jgi:hypothetical protein
MWSWCVVLCSCRMGTPGCTLAKPSCLKGQITIVDTESSIVDTIACRVGAVKLGPIIPRGRNAGVEGREPRHACI